MAFVLKCKVECALRMLRETQSDDVVGIVAVAEDIELQYNGVPLRDMTTIERYGIDNKSDIMASSCLSHQRSRRAAARGRVQPP